MMLKPSLILTAVFLVGITTSQESNGPLVRTKSGMVQGLLGKTRNGRSIMEFLGIPYAQPATGSLRFQSPQRADPWTGVFSAQKECSACVQQLFLAEAVRTQVSGSEDCLCVNVFTPTVSSKAKLPVIVWIHGGGYVGGSSAIALYGPDLLLDKDVVLVTFNYRLGVMGYLTTGDDVIPGNFGMKDQALALAWVKENIANFGGNPNSISLFGESSGAASVGLHQYSPLSRDLFQKSIIHSGSAYCPWAVTKPEVLKGRTEVVAELVGCPKTPSSALLDCLRKLPAEQIVNTTHTFVIWDIEPVVIWTPTIENPTVKGAFLTEDPKKSSQSLTKPLLTGFNNAEGGLKTTSVEFGNVQQKFDYWNNNYDYIAPISLLYNNTNLDNIATTRSIRKFYFGSDTALITPGMLQPITELYGDVWFSLGTIQAATKQQGKTYLYYYNYNKTTTLCPVFLQTSPPLNVGACHLDELMNLFPFAGFAPKVDPTNPDYQLSVKMIEMWTNFVKCGNPSTKDLTWNPIKSADVEYLEITNSGMRMSTFPLRERRQFWNSLGAFGK